MRLADFLDNTDDAEAVKRNPVVLTNALYKAKDSFNCYLTASQAISLARHLLEKAQLIVDAGLEDAAVQVWNQGEDSERLYCGLIQARKGPRKSRKRPETGDTGRG
jgi:hypothetical protein